VAHGKDGDQAAETFIQQMSDQGYQILNHKDLNATGKAEAFRGLVRTSFDFRRIGMFALAKHRRQASREDVVTFLRVFENYAINIYQARLGEYSGERLKVSGSMIRKETAKGREVIVKSKISFSDGSVPWDVNWRVYARDGKYQIVDVQVAGIWMALEQRSQFSSIILREKGSVAALTEILQEKAGATADL
jgi:phospholipid transport system substrate-binding protein